jgi:hypothetical protein
MAADPPAVFATGTALDSDDDDELPVPIPDMGGDVAGFTDSDDENSDGDNGAGSDGDMSNDEAAILQAARKPVKRRRSDSKKAKVPNKKKARNVDIRRFVEGEAEEDDDEDLAFRNRGDVEEGAAAEAAAARYRQEVEERKQDALASKSVQDIAAYYEQRNK